MISNKDNALRMSKSNNQDVMILNTEVCPESKGEEGTKANKMTVMTPMEEAQIDIIELGVGIGDVLLRKVLKKKPNLTLKRISNLINKRKITSSQPHQARNICQCLNHTIFKSIQKQ